METKGSLWDLFQQRGLSRRAFLKTCVAVTGILGLAPSMLGDVVSAAENKVLPVVIWLHGHECTGCDESFIRSQSPMASDVLLNMISLEYSDTLAAASGEHFDRHLKATMEKYAGNYILATEGAVPLAEDGIYCMVGGRPYVTVLKEVAANAAAVIEFGSCATWGGVQAARPNPTQSVAVSDVISGIPIINVPGCPPIPEVMTAVVMHYALFGEIPPLDSLGRPKQFYGNRIHDTCYRRAFFDSGMFVENFNDAGAKAGWCLYKMGCRGPSTQNSCGNMRWWNGLSYPIQSGHGCIGCSSKGFWDNDMFYQRLPDIPVAASITTADKVGLVAAGAAVGGVVVHGALSAAQKNKRQDAKLDDNVRGPQA
jgi:hydrogenase small subunit